MLNPVFRKDMRILFRNVKMYIGLTLYLLILMFITNTILRMINLNSYNGFNPEYIITAYLVMLGFQMLTITFAVPAFTSSSITGERERQTLDFMFMTRMSSWDIVVGKLMSSLLLVVLLIVASMPIYAIIFYYGGISIIGFLLNTVFLLIYALFIGSISILFSTMFKKTAAATAISNLFVLGLSIGTFIAAGFLYSIFEISNVNESVFFFVKIICATIMSINPILCFISIVDSQMGTDTAWSMFNSLFDIDVDFGFLQVWHLVAIVYIVLSILLLKMASKTILPIKRRRKKK